MCASACEVLCSDVVDVAAGLAVWMRHHVLCAGLLRHSCTSLLGFHDRNVSCTQDRLTSARWLGHCAAGVYIWNAAGYLWGVVLGLGNHKSLGGLNLQ